MHILRRKLRSFFRNDQNVIETNVLENLEKVSRAMSKAKDVEHIIDDVLHTVFSIFDCDRIWLFHPCDPNAPTFRVLAEKNKPEYPGAFTLDQDLPMTKESAKAIRKALSSSSPVLFGPESENKIDDIASQYSVRSQMITAVHPKTGAPWMFGVHQCSHARVWTENEQKLFREIGFRVVEGLNNLILLRDLRKSELKYRRFFTTVQNGWAYHKTITNAEGKPVNYIFLEVNEAFEELTGLKSEFIIGKPITEVFSHDDQTLQCWINRFGNVSLTGRSITFEGYLETMNTWYSVSASSPERGFFITVYENISERKESFERFRTVLDGLESLVYVADMETYELLFINKYGRDIWGDINGKMCWQTLQSGQTGPCPFCTNSKLLDSDLKPSEPYTWEFQNTVTNEWYECRDQAIHWTDGRIVRMEIATNITDRKEAEKQKEKLEEKFRQVQKMEAIGTLAGGIAHDFNNILSAIMGYAELACGESQRESKIWRYLDQVINAGYRARDLVGQILAFSRQSDVNIQPIQPHLVIKEALKLLRASIPTTIEIKENITKCGRIMADPSQLHQIIMNLCTNAYHAMRGSGGALGVVLLPIKIASNDFLSMELDIPPGSYIKLEVSDTGKGMDKATLAKIFEPYFTTKGKREGTGLGLAVVHGIVESYGGHIKVYSEEGLGTNFHIYLPKIDSDNSIREKREIAEKLPKGHESILIVDDEKNLVEMFHIMLKSLGYQVTAMTNSVEAFHTFKGSPQNFDLVISDMTMPNMTGLQLSQNILAVRPETPIILCTGFSELLNKEHAKAMGIREYILKPVIKKDIAKIIRKVLDGG